MSGAVKSELRQDGGHGGNNAPAGKCTDSYAGAENGGLKGPVRRMLNVFETKKRRQMV